MRYSIVLTALLSVANARSVLSDKQSVIADNNLQVPGESPLQFCEPNRQDDIVTITSVDLLPNPPQAGKELVIKAVGTVKQTIEEGAYIDLTVKYGLIRLISTKADLCEQIKNVDLECPIEEGILSIVKTVELPEQIPPGTYTVHADVWTKDAEAHITCLDATVKFGGNKLTDFLEL